MRRYGRTLCMLGITTVMSVLCMACANDGGNTAVTTQATTVANETTTESITEATTEATAEATTESVTEATIEATTESTTESTIEATTEVVTEETTEIALTDFEKYYNPDINAIMTKNEHAGKVVDITYYSEVIGADRNAKLYLPYNYDENETYPVLYMIHGIGCESGQWFSMGCTKMFDNMIDSGELKPFIAVCPSVIPKDGLDKNTLSAVNIQAFTDFVQEYDQDLKPYLMEHYHISEKREDTAICGLSMGGMEALRVGFSYLDQFAFIGSFSAAPTLEKELLTTEKSDFTPELVLICSGDNDGTVGNNPYSYHAELEKNNVEHIWYEHPGGSHEPKVWNLGLYNFLLRIGGGFTE